MAARALRRGGGARGGRPLRSRRTCSRDPRGGRFIRRVRSRGWRCVGAGRAGVLGGGRALWGGGCDSRGARARFQRQFQLWRRGHNRRRGVRAGVLGGWWALRRRARVRAGVRSRGWGALRRDFGARGWRELRGCGFLRWVQLRRRRRGSDGCDQARGYRRREHARARRLALRRVDTRRGYDGSRGTTPGTTASGLLSGASGLLSGTAGAVAAKDPNADLAADKPSQLTTKVGLSAHLQALARMPSTLVPERELMAIATAYNADPHNPDYRFRHFFHNVVEPHRRVRPPGVDELKWRKLLEEVGGEHNGNGLWPVPGDGFKTLFERAQVQDAELANQREYLKAVQDRARDIERFRGAQLAEKVKTVAKTHSELSHRLLRVMRKLEGAEADYHTRQGGSDASNGGKGGNYPYPRRPASQEGLNEQERELAARLRKLQGALGKSANSLPRRVDAIAAAQRAEKAVDAADGARRRPAVGSAFSDENGGAVVANRSPNDVVSGGAKGKDGAGGKGPGSLDDDADAPPIDEAAAQAFDKIIAEQQEATRHLAEVLRNDMRDLAVLNRERGEEAAEKAKGRKFYQSYW